MVAALAPSDIAAGSLPDAVRRAAGRLADEAGLHVECAVDSPLPRLATATEVVLLRGVQEALVNVREHAGAGAVLVRLSAADETVRLRVRDDGCGFSPTAPTDGFGLRVVRSRVERWAGG
ncbi:sensor histidine kinase [Amycolatopsis sp. FDAARGOS 1241]|uniref:sensor histidine kinase n=1 Tax=Amycolatopsis sp. FDAARGOS 1241 TaxID=2778070 RepID=UPI001951F364|nr:ATP-binding protein [Amycolatopsis sp. FDAARGOS 1241]QRP46794.1 hypothetical protein I6J71_01655 [Amycolatopsis sp. FDAARGOS 1241]